MAIGFCDIAVLLTLFFAAFVSYTQDLSVIFRWSITGIFSLLMSMALTPRITNLVEDIFSFELHYNVLIIFVSLLLVLIALVNLGLKLLEDKLSFRNGNILGKLFASLTFILLLLHLTIPFCEFLGKAGFDQLLFNTNKSIPLEEVQVENAFFRVDKGTITLVNGNTMLSDDQSLISMVDLSNKGLYANGMLNVHELEDNQIGMLSIEMIFFEMGKPLLFSAVGFELNVENNILVIINKDTDLFSYAPDAYLYNYVRAMYRYTTQSLSFLFPFVSGFQSYVINAL